MGKAVSSSVVTSEKEYTGSIRRYSERNGMGFISCEECREKYNVDVRIFSDEFSKGNFAVGEDVAFRIVLDGRDKCPKNQPWATEVRKLGNQAVAESQMSDPISSAHQRAGRSSDAL